MKRRPKVTTEHEALGWKRLYTIDGPEPEVAYRRLSDDYQTCVNVSLESSIRAQVDEDVRRLVAAARLADDHIWCECVLQPPPHEGILCKPHKALRAALEPFKAVSPTPVEGDE